MAVSKKPIVRILFAHSGTSLYFESISSPTVTWILIRNGYNKAIKEEMLNRFYKAITQ